MNILTLEQHRVDASLEWRLPSSALVQRRGLCNLAQPSLQRAQRTPWFFFQEATLLLVASGRMDLSTENMTISINTSTPLLLVEPGTSANLLKTPTGPEQLFRSIFLTFSPDLLTLFQRSRPSEPKGNSTPIFQQALLDHELESTLRLIYASIAAPGISEERLKYRLLDLLAGLAERGYSYRKIEPPGTAGRVRVLIGEAPDHPWTAGEMGRELAMSEATLRRRLTQERVRFEELLIDVRMHHALMLVQTTDWSITLIAQACGYKSRARFSERFQQRFGYLPSTVR